jgi:hypothetical protein
MASAVHFCKDVPFTDSARAAKIRVMSDLSLRVRSAAADGKLLESSARNIETMLERSESKAVADSIRELVEREEWAELNDRFFKTIAFGTGGLRGRSIGKIVTAAERGEPQPLDRPQRPCVGTNAMNFYNVSRATQGLVAYLKEWFAKNALPGRPKIVVAHDTRHFSRDFTELTALVAVENGCDVCVFEGPAFDAATFVHRALDECERGYRDYREPQPAARQRIQGLLFRWRASGRAACERDHREGQRCRVGCLYAGAAGWTR